MANGDEISSEMNKERAKRVRAYVDDGDFSQCPVEGQKEVQLFLVDGMAAILIQSRRGNLYAMLSGGGVGGVMIILWEIFKVVHPLTTAAQVLSGN
ncbi:MAG: hypothetical protein WC130_04425 [Kiritimatiellia bacterium]